MKVFRAEVRLTFYVAAETDDEAQEVAAQYAEEAVSDGFPDVEVSGEVRADRPLMSDHSLDSIPYGEADDRTIRQILADPEPEDPSAEPEPPKDTWTRPLFPEPEKG